jgi:N-acetylglucosaminyldiphosphoundecaprenol N-acetyl-beta-D-mannosaminyltransferase
MNCPDHELNVLKLQSVSMLGFRLSTLSDKDVVRLVRCVIKEDRRYIVANHNFHSLYLWLRESRMRELYAVADHVLIDGMSLIFLGRVLSLRLTRENRATSLDFLPLLIPEAIKQRWRIYYLGSKPGVAEKGAAKLRNQYLGLQIRTHHGYFVADETNEENQRVLEDINSYDPHVLFVGMGMPRQELWILKNRDSIRAAVIFPCGAHMDYVAGEIPTAPRWLATIYLEWLYRLATEPRRLWRRYLFEPWFVCSQLVLRDHKSQTDRLIHSEHERSLD